MNQKQLERFRAQLENLLVDLDQLAAERDASSEVVELDQARTGRVSRVDAMQQQAMALANRDRAVLERQRIAAALQRIEEDHFGDCSDCDSEIALARLEANPTVTLCIDCAEKRES